MQRPPRSAFDFESDVGPVLWGAVAQLAVAIPVLFAVGDWTVILSTALLAGIVASAYGDFYSQAANNGFLAALIGTCCLFPLFFIRHFELFQSGGETGDSVLYATVFSSAELLALAPAGAILGYISASVVAIGRRKRRARKGV
jgi:hypothetical protein